MRASWHADKDGLSSRDAGGADVYLEHGITAVFVEVDSDGMHPCGEADGPAALRATPG